MTRRVWSCRATGVYINESELAFMRVVTEGGRSKRALSYAEIQRLLDCSIGTARNMPGSLRNKGFLTVRSRFRKDGGQVANEYALTAKGIGLLASLLGSEGSEPGS